MKTFTTLLILFTVSASLFLTISPQQAKAGSDIVPDKIENTVSTALVPEPTEVTDSIPGYSIVGDVLQSDDTEIQNALDIIHDETSGDKGEVVTKKLYDAVNAQLEAMHGQSGFTEENAEAFLNAQILQLSEGKSGIVNMPANPFASRITNDRNLSPQLRALANEIADKTNATTSTDNADPVETDETNYDYLFESNTEDDLERAEEELRQSEATLKAKIDELEAIDNRIEAQEEELQRLKAELEKLQGGND